MNVVYNKEEKEPEQSGSFLFSAETRDEAPLKPPETAEKRNRQALRI